MCFEAFESNFEPLVDQHYKVLWEEFESVRTTSIIMYFNTNSMSFESFEPLVDQHYKVLSHVFDVFSKVSNQLEPLVEQHCKVLW